MSIAKTMQALFGQKDPTSKAEKLYKKGMRLTRQQEYRQAVPLLEEAGRLDPMSAQIHQCLGYSYSRVAGEYEGDEATMNSWMNRAADTFWKAITLHRAHGGLEQKQLTTAMELVAAVDRIKISNSNTPLEEQRRKIFLEYKSKKDSTFDLHSAAGAIIRGDSLTDMSASLRRHSNEAEDKAIAYAANKFNITERVLRAIIQEAENKRW
jgi:tetratricopeptide (TPR) repeat protein